MPARTIAVITALVLAIAAIWTATDGRAQSTEPLSATIYQGTCEELGGAVFILSDVAPASEGQLTGLGSAIPVLASATRLDASLNMVLGSPHALVLSSGGDTEPVACGDIGGVVSESDTFFGIADRNDSGYTGIGSLRSPEDEQTTVTILAAQGLGAAVPAPPATPAAATPVSADSEETTDVTIEMVDIDFNPNELTIPANIDVTVHLPNLGQAVHNFYVDALDIQSEDVEPGGETTVTINAEPGEYEYYCAVPGHREAGMVGTLFVE
jgi:uncharacterized cupredoxin-like copper-binding protein